MNIYISNLNYSVTDAELQTLFSTYGEISSAKVITDRETGRSRGFGFVEMPDDSAAQQAIDALNQSDFVGKTISVNVAKPKTDRPSGGFSRGGGYGDDRSGGFKKRY